MTDIKALRHIANKHGWFNTKLLIIDDSRTQTALLSSLLTNLGMKQITAVHTPDEAIIACQQQHFQLIIVDYHLDTILSGAELLSLLRQKKLIQLDCASLLLSGDQRAEIILAGLEAAPDAFITKPVSMDKLVKSIDKAWCSRKITRPVAIALQYNEASAIAACQRQWQHKRTSRRLEKIWLDLLAETEQWQKLADTITMIEQVHGGGHLQLAKARLLIQQKDEFQAIKLLKTLIDNEPLYIDAYDLLIMAFERLGKPHLALQVAQEALKLTPNASARAQQTARLAAQCKHTDAIIKAGKKLAENLPLVGDQWLEEMDCYLCQARMLFRTLDAIEQQKLFDGIEQIFAVTRKRVRPGQRNNANMLEQLAMLQFSLINPADLTTKKALFAVICEHYYALEAIPLVLKFNVIEPLLRLGEAELGYDLLLLAGEESQGNPTAMARYDAIKQNSAVYKRALLLLRAIHKMRETLSQHPELVQPEIRSWLVRFPLSTPLHFLWLEAAVKTKQPRDNRITTSLCALEAIPLPSLLADRRQQLRNVYPRIIGHQASIK